MQKILLLIVFSFILSAEPLPPSEKYNGDISTKEKRIRDFKQEISDVSYSFPAQLKLFFKKTSGDYAVFYDRNGDEVYYRYRKNKFDSEFIDLIYLLIR
jgi:hypothetical protein